MHLRAAAACASAAAVAVLVLVRLRRVCLALSLARRRRALPHDAALLLGGDEHRERTAAALLAGTAPPSACVAGPSGAARDAQLRLCAGAAALPLVIASSCALRGAAPFVALGVARARLVADDRATDTVGNFTAASPLLLRAGAKHVLVLTSESHARRAAAVAGLALGCCGVGATVLPLREAVPAAGGARGGESRVRTAHDVLRAALWAATGLTGGALGRLKHPERFYHLDASLE